VTKAYFSVGAVALSLKRKRSDLSSFFMLVIGEFSSATPTNDLAS
jgi:hypothetical protein